MMRFQVTNTWLGPRSSRRMLVYVPADAETERRVRTLMEAN